MFEAIPPRVPFGIASEGSFRSPLRFAPAIIPVTAGKKTANTVKKLVSPPVSGSKEKLGMVFLHAKPTKPSSLFVSVEGIGGEPGTMDVIDIKKAIKVASADLGKQAGGIIFWKME